MLNMYRCMNRTSIYQTLEINQAQLGMRFLFPFQDISGEFFLIRNVFLGLFGEL